MSRAIEVLQELREHPGLPFEVLPSDEEIIRRTIHLTRLQYEGADQSEIDAAARVLCELTVDYDPTLFIRERRRGPGRPRNGGLELVYHAARMLWMYVFGQPWTQSSGDLEHGPRFDEGPDNSAAEFLVAFAQDVSPSITAANCHSMHDLLRREVHYSSKALEQRRRRRSERQSRRSNS
jgi:hypothetical protein